MTGEPERKRSGIEHERIGTPQHPMKLPRECARRDRDRRGPSRTAVTAVTALIVLVVIGSTDAGRRATPVRPVTARSFERAARPMNGRLLFVRNEVIYTMAADGRRVHRLGSGHDPAWSPDGTQIAYDNFTPGECGGDCARVFVVRSDGTGRRRATNLDPGPVVELDPSWSPDGQQIVYSRSFLPVQAFGLGVVAIGGAPRDLTSVQGKHWDFSSTWSPDGKWICFDRLDRLYLITPEGQSLHRLVSARGVQGEPDWSPDGRRILFTLRGDLFTVARDGSALTSIVRSKLVESWPIWSPDGRKIAFLRSKKPDDAGDVFIANASGSGQHRVASKVDGGLDWRSVP